MTRNGRPLTVAPASTIFLPMRRHLPTATTTTTRIGGPRGGRVR